MVSLRAYTHATAMGTPTKSSGIKTRSLMRKPDQASALVEVRWEGTFVTVALDGRDDLPSSVNPIASLPGYFLQYAICDQLFDVQLCGPERDSQPFRNLRDGHRRFLKKHVHQLERG